MSLTFVLLIANLHSHSNHISCKLVLSSAKSIDPHRIDYNRSIHDTTGNSPSLHSTRQNLEFTKHTAMHPHETRTHQYIWSPKYIETTKTYPQWFFIAKPRSEHESMQIKQIARLQQHKYIGIFGIVEHCHESIRFCGVSIGGMRRLNGRCGDCWRLVGRFWVGLAWRWMGGIVLLGLGASQWNMIGQIEEMDSSMQNYIVYYRLSWICN